MFGSRPLLSACSTDLPRRCTDEPKIRPFLVTTHLEFQVPFNRWKWNILIKLPIDIWMLNSKSVSLWSSVKPGDSAELISAIGVSQCLVDAHRLTKAQPSFWKPTAPMHRLSHTRWTTLSFPNISCFIILSGVSQEKKWKDLNLFLSAFEFTSFAHFSAPAPHREDSNEGESENSAGIHENLEIG